MSLFEVAICDHIAILCFLELYLNMKIAAVARQKGASSFVMTTSINRRHTICDMRNTYEKVHNLHNAVLGIPYGEHKTNNGRRLTEIF